MTKTILITGSTDGIGFETAKSLAAEGHRVLLHGRSAEKLEAAERAIGGETGCYLADLSSLAEVEALGRAVASDHPALDVLINNAGVLKMSNPVTADGLDARFAVNTLAPYALTRRLLLSMSGGGRVVNLSSAAQAPVNLEALKGGGGLTDMDAYAQSKLALTAWSHGLAAELGEGGPMIVAVNPGSLLATKMVKDAFGADGNDIRIGADILVRAALSDEFADASGRYFDNDAGGFGPPHPDALDPDRTRELIGVLDAMLADLR